MDMNIVVLPNPYEGTKLPIMTRGVMTDAKIAKLNNVEKRPVLVAKWEERRVKEESREQAPPRDYHELLDSIGITVVNFAEDVNNSGAKKLRVNKIVNEKMSNVFANTEKINEPEPNMETKEDVVNLINQINVVETPIAEEVKREDVHGKHEKTGEIPVDDIKNAIRKELNQSIPAVSSRMEKNAVEHETVAKEEAPKQEVKATDMDLYNNLIHNKKEDDISRQLQGAREELNFEKEESKKIAEKYGQAVREYEELKEAVENKKRIKAQQEKQELNKTLNNLNNLKKENLEKTNDLTSLQAEIAKLKAEKQAIESEMYSDYNESHSYGRSSAA